GHALALERGAAARDGRHPPHARRPDRADRAGRARGRPRALGARADRGGHHLRCHRALPGDRARGRALSRHHRHGRAGERGGRSGARARPRIRGGRVSALVPLIACWVGGALLLGLDGRRAAVGWAAVAVLAFALACDVALLVDLLTSGAPAHEVVTGGWPAGVGIRLRVDALALFFGAICALVLAAVMIHEQRSSVHERLFPALMLLLSAGLHGAFFTGDLFNFYVFFELSVV